MPEHKIAIDLGTVNTVVSMYGTVTSEATVIAHDRKSGRIHAIGNQAERLIGRQADKIEVLQPVVNGTITHDAEMIEFLKFVTDYGLLKRTLKRVTVAVAIACNLTPAKRRVIKEVAGHIANGHVYLIHQPVAAAIGEGIDVMEPKGTMIIDIGGGTTDFAAVSGGGVIQKYSVNTAGNYFDQLIVDYVRRKYHRQITALTARSIKHAIGECRIQPEIRKATLRSRSIENRQIGEIEIDSNEIREILTPGVDQIVHAADKFLEQVSGSPSIINDIQEYGIILTGGGSQLPGLDQYLETSLGIKIHTSANPLQAVAIGLEKILNSQTLLDGLNVEVSDFTGVTSAV